MYSTLQLSPWKYFLIRIQWRMNLETSSSWNRLHDPSIASTDSSYDSVSEVSLQRSARDETAFTLRVIDAQKISNSLHARWKLKTNIKDAACGLWKWVCLNTSLSLFMITLNEIKGVYASSKRSRCFFSDCVEFKVSKQWHIAPVHAIKYPNFQQYAHWPLPTNNKTKMGSVASGQYSKVASVGCNYLVVMKTR